jgi:4-hydroxy-tetrahydrodipicolinate reductase
MAKYRVIQYGAGNTGKFVLRSILTQPELRLVGLGVHGAAKARRDAGDLCRLPPTGVIATRDIDSLVAMEADCVSFMPTDPHAGNPVQPGSHTAGLFDLLCRFLASGKNVIATAPNALVHAPSLGAGIINRLERACREGNSSFHYVGVSPGFMPDRLVLNLTAISARVEAILVQEMMNYGDYDDREMLFDFYGFGRDPQTFDSSALRASFGRTLGGSVALVAEGLGVKLDEVATTIKFAATEEGVTIRTGEIAAGKIGALWIRSWGMVEGTPRIKVEHITRIDDRVAPDWPQFSGGKGEGYRIEIRGAPSMSMELELGAFGRNPMADAGWAVAGHLANSIPALCNAPSGVRSFIDLPAVSGRFRMIR